MGFYMEKLKVFSNSLIEYIRHLPGKVLMRKIKKWACVEKSLLNNFKITGISDFFRESIFNKKFFYKENILAEIRETGRKINENFELKIEEELERFEANEMGLNGDDSFSDYGEEGWFDWFLINIKEVY